MILALLEGLVLGQTFVSLVIEFGNFCKVWCLDKPLWFCLLSEGLVIGQAFVILVTFVWFGHW